MAARVNGNRRRRDVATPSVAHASALVIAAALMTVVGALSPLWSTGWTNGLIGPGVAGAHTDLLDASPAPEAVVGGRIEVIGLLYAEPVTNVAVTFFAPDGSTIDGAVVEPNGQAIDFRFDAPLQAGRHQVVYSMISADGDATTDWFWFTYEPGASNPLPLDAALAENAAESAAESDADGGAGRLGLQAILAVWALAVLAIGGWWLMGRERSRAAAQGR